MSDFLCPECKGSGEYRGLNTVEPCRACGGKIGKSVIEYAAECAGISLAPDYVRQIGMRASGGQSIRHEIEEQITIPVRTESGIEYHKIPFDEICPAELEGIAIGRTVSVSIECKDFMRAFEVMDRFIDRPIFGLPPQSFRFKSAGWSAPDKDGKREITATLLYKPRGDEDKFTLLNEAGEVVSEQWLYESDPCQDMLFIPILED